MGVQFDLIIPPVIAGLLLILIVRVNTSMMGSSIDSRLNNEMQQAADLGVTLIEEHLRGLDQIDFSALPDSSLRFVHFDGDSIFVNRSNRNLEIVRKDAETMAADTLVFSLHVKHLSFRAEPDFSPAPVFIRVSLETESLPVDHAATSGGQKTVNAFAEKRIFLRNLAASDS